MHKAVWLLTEVILARSNSSQNYKERASKTGRPVSPHITIYTFPLNGLSSGANRVTGFILSFGCAGLGAIEIIGGSGSAASVMQFIGNDCGSFLAATAKFCVTYPLLYHYQGGVRHLLWDWYPEMITNEQTLKTSYYLFGSTTLAAIAAAFM
jgi:succinate dehydrogenase (ubiquinone) cytochrome b560 subunit